MNWSENNESDNDENYCRTGSPHCRCNYCFENGINGASNRYNDDPAENIREDLKGNYTYEQRSNLARNFGPNWANIMSGLGDQ